MIYGIAITMEIPVNDGLIHGVVKVYLGDVLIKAFEYKKGVLDGLSKKYSKIGKPLRDKLFKDGKLVQTIYYNKNGEAVYMPYGRTDIKYDENEILVYVKDNSRVNKTIYIKYKGNISQKVDYKDGKINGKKIEYSSEGTVEKESSYIDGKLDGNTIFYYPNKMTRYVWKFKNNLRDDKSYTKDGFVYSKGQYIKGNRVGLFISYNQNDKTLASTVNFKDGFLDGSTSYYDHGTLYKKGHYKDGKKEGIWYRYYENYKVKSKVNYKDDQKIGKTTVYER